MEAYLVQARVLQALRLLGVDGGGVQMDVVILPEPVLEELYHVQRALHVEQRVPSGDPRSQSVHGFRLGEDLLIGADALLVGVDHVLALLLQRHGAVIAVPSASSCDEQDHLRPVYAEPAPVGDLAAVGRSAFHLLEHAG